MLGDWEIPRISSVESRERRSFAELAVPGKVGSLFHDMRSDPTRLTIQGSLFGEEARNEFLEEVRQRFQAGEPVTFVADIVTATEVEYVIIDELELLETNRDPEEIHYRIALRESPPPPPPPDPLGGLDTSLLDQAAGLLDSVSGALDLIDGLGSVPDIVDPTEPLTGALNDVTSATDGLADAITPLADLFRSEE